MTNHFDDVVKRKKRMTLNFGVNIFAHCTACEKTNKFNVIPQHTISRIRIVIYIATVDIARLICIAAGTTAVTTANTVSHHTVVIVLLYLSKGAERSFVVVKG